MAKDNQGKTSDPGANKNSANKGSQSKPGTERPKQLKNWRREHWNQYALEVGIKEPERFSHTKELRSVLKKASLYPGTVGGTREGAGREEKDDRPVIYTAVEMMEAHILEPIEVKIPDATQEVGYRTEKVATLKVLLDQLRRDALSQKNSANERTRASEAYLDRILGKPKQALELSGTIKTEEQNVPSAAEMAAARAYEDALEKGLPVPSPLSR